jgi:enoyl-CoA hydratase/carnithine racemase
MSEDLANVVKIVNGDDSVRVVVISGRGDSFSLGRELANIPTGHKTQTQMYGAAVEIAKIEKPVIAAINGDAIGQGLELALAADIRVAVKKVRLGIPHLPDMTMPSDGGTQRLPRIIGQAKALELLLTGDIIDGGEAERIGLVSRAVAQGEFRQTIRVYIDQISGGAPIAARYLKEAVSRGVDVTLSEGMRLEADLSFLLHTTEDRNEGIKSFLQKRQPKFRGK